MVLILSHIHFLTTKQLPHIVMQVFKMEHQLVMSFSSLNLLVAQPYKHNFNIIVKMILKIKSFCLNYIENTFGNDQLFLSDKV